MAIEMTCPTCGSHDISKNGTSHRGKQNYKCRDCGRQFVEDPQWQPKPKETKALVNRLLHEKISLAGIARATEVSKSWLQGHANRVYEAVPQTTKVIPKPQGPLRVQMDELWSFVEHKGNKQWVWLAMDVETREIIGCQIGNRSRESAIALWQSIPAVYRQCAKVYTDFSRFFLVSRFSRKLENHIGAIWMFIHEYNRQIREKLAENEDLSFSLSFTKIYYPHQKGHWGKEWKLK